MASIRPIPGPSLHLLLLLSLVTYQTSPTLAVLDPVDYLALQEIKKSLSDLPGARFFARWDFTGDPCSFPGVACAGGRVAGLALGDPRAGAPGLAGRLPAAALSRLSALAELSLAPGAVSGLLPAALPAGLRLLALAGNRLTGGIPADLPRRLRLVDLSGNSLSGEIPGTLTLIPTLTTLILAHNRFSGRIPPFLPSSPLLRLDLRGNALSGAVPAIPSTVEYLSLAGNRLSGPVDWVLVRINRLSFLDLSMNRLTGPIPGDIFGFPSLTSIHLQRNQFYGEVRPAATVAAGAVVDLSYNRLQGAVPAELAAAERLYLDYNRFSGDVPAAIVAAVAAGGMRLLYLHDNYLTGFGKLAAAIPASATVCLQYNCMVPPVAASACPRRAGPQKTRPPAQCPAWRKGSKKGG